MNSAKDLRQGPRKDRLKLALRENLKRRKLQARGRGDAALIAATASSRPEDASPNEAAAHQGGAKESGE